MGSIKDSLGVITVLCLLLAGCGGGGGGTATTGTAVSTTSSVPTGDAGGVSFQDMGGDGEVTVAWTGNPTNVDGSCSAGIQAYRISVGLTASVFLVSESVPLGLLSCTTISSSSCGPVQRCSYVIQGLTAATWHVAVQTVDVFGYTSAYSEAVAATVY